MLRQAAQPGQTADQQSPANETGPLFPVGEHGKWGYIDKTGKIVIPLHYYLAYPFSEGLAFIQPFPVLGSRAIRLQFIDKAGLMVMSKIYSYAQPFSEGLAVVAVPGERGLGFVDKTGKMVTSQYDFAKPFSEGLAAVKDGGKWGYLDKTDNMVISPQFSEAYRFSDGLAAVKDGGKWGYIDKIGRTVIPPQYDLAYQHVEGLAAVKISTRLDTWSSRRSSPTPLDSPKGWWTSKLAKNGAMSTKPVRW